MPNRFSRTTTAAALAAVAMTVLACGGGAPPPAGSTTRARGEERPLLRVGHYSSGDGMIGFVLDRTGAVPKLRLDGSSDVLLLEVRRTSAHTYDLVNHEKHLGVSIDDEGGVTFSEKGRGPNREMILDAAAAPL